MPSVIEEFKDVSDALIFAENILATVREPLLVLNGGLHVIFANRAFYERFSTTEVETVGREIYKLGNGQWDIPLLRKALVDIIPHDTHFDNYEVELDFPRIGRRIMLLNGRQVKQAGEQQNLILLAIEDVTDRITAERKLRESEEKYRGFIQTINSIIFKFDNEGKITFFNRFAEQIFGCSEKELLGKPVIGTILPERDEEGRDQKEMVEGVLKTPEQYYFKQAEGRKKDGGKVWFQWSAKEIRDERGVIREVLIVGNDITGEIEYRNMLQEMRGLTESSPDIMARFDGELRLAYANPLFMNILGRSRDEVIGKHLRDIGLPQDIAALLENALKQARGNEGRLKTVVGLKGREYHVQVLPEDERRLSFKVYAADITDRRQMEDALRRSEYQLRTLVDNTPDIIFRLNRRLEYVYVNPAYERIAGLAKEQFIGRTNGQLGMERQLVEFWQSAVEEVIEKGRDRVVEFEMSGFFGRRDFSARIIPEFEESGQVETALVIARDITERKHAEEELASMKR